MTFPSTTFEPRRSVSSMLCAAIAASLLCLPAALRAKTPETGGARGGESTSTERADASREREAEESRTRAANEREEFFSPAHRRRLYREGRLSYTRAALWTLVFPGLGNFYAKQYLIGGLAASLMSFAAVFVGYGFAVSELVFVWVGLGTAGSAYAGGWMSSYFGVRAYNDLLHERLNVPDRETPTAHTSPPKVKGIRWTLFRF